ncbi:MAG: UDP-N-acetylglucosamine--N-acetylmuramyl-(pentapeptide) pyrophosphoryl-undecaprenol N-acetylglucosamine transferase [Bdellovibrionota bacterium]
MVSRKIWIVAAGTGGHIFPGLSLAKTILEKDPSAQIEFFGTEDRLEARLVPEHGFKLRFLTAGRWKGRGVVGKVLGLFSLVGGYVQALSIILREGRPRFLMSVGGYVSLPMAMACGTCGVPVFLLEPNIRAGLANRVVSRWARFAFCSPGADATQLFSCPVEDLGSPLRGEIRPIEIRDPVKKLLVLGGSQGAKVLNEAVLRAYKKLGLKEKGITLKLQSGEAHLRAAGEVKAELGLGSEVELLSFIKDIPAVIAASDVVVARAGAMTVAELAAAGMPTVFVPFPFAADDHQRKNAELLAHDGAAWCVDQRDEYFKSKLEEYILKLCVPGQASFDLRTAVAKRFIHWARPRASDDIAQRLLALTGSGK